MADEGQRERRCAAEDLGGATARPRAGAGDTRRLWGTWDRFGRWRSPRWRSWVRTLPCVCNGSYQTIAAHFRYGSQVGTGAKPDDFLVYPVTHETHQRWHQTGQPSWAQQAEWVAGVWRMAARRGLLAITDTAGFMAVEQLTSVQDGAFNYDNAVRNLRAALETESVLITGPAGGWIDF